MKSINRMRERTTALRSRATTTRGRVQPRPFQRLKRWLRARDEGAAIVELALVLPMLLLLTTGIFTFGIAINNYQMLTFAVNQGGLVLQELRQMPGASDPCRAVGNAVIAAAPNLTSTGANGLQLTVQLDNGAASYGPASAATASCTGGSTYMTAAMQGTSVTVTATYSCNLTVYGVNYMPSCTLSATSTEQLQ